MRRITRGVGRRSPKPLTASKKQLERGELVKAIMQLKSNILAQKKEGKEQYIKHATQLMQHTTEGLDFHAEELTSLKSESPLFSVIASVETSYIVLQMLALNQQDILKIMFREEVHPFPSLKQVLPFIFDKILTGYFAPDSEEAGHLQVICSILHDILRGPEGSLVRENYMRELEDVELRQTLLDHVMTHFNKWLPTASEENDIDQVCGFYEDLMIGLVEDSNPLLSVIDAITLCFQPGEEEVDLPTDGHSLAVLILYRNLFHCESNKLPALNVYMTMLDAIRGKEGSRARAAFLAVWDDLDFLQAFKEFFGQELTPNLVAIIKENDTSGMAFWTRILSSIKSDGMARDMILANAYGANSIAVPVALLPESLEVDKATAEAETVTVPGWASYFCLLHDYDWDQIRPKVNLLCEFLENSAPFTDPSCRRMTQTLLPRLSKDNKCDEVAVQILGALAGHSIESITLLDRLDTVAGLLQRVFTKAIEMGHTKAIIAFMKNSTGQTQYRDILLEPFYQDPCAEHLTQLCNIIIALTNNKYELTLLVNKIVEKRCFDKVLDHAVKTKAAGVIYSLFKNNQLGKKSDEQRMVAQQLMTNIYKNCGPDEDPFQAIVEDPALRKRQSAVRIESMWGHMKEDAHAAVSMEQAEAAVAAGANGHFELPEGLGGVAPEDAFTGAILSDDWHTALRILCEHHKSLKVKSSRQFLSTANYDESGFKDAFDCVLSIMDGDWAILIAILTTPQGQFDIEAIKGLLAARTYADSGHKEQIDELLAGIGTSAGMAASFEDMRASSHERAGFWKRHKQPSVQDGAALRTILDNDIKEHHAFHGNIGDVAGNTVFKLETELMEAGAGAFAFGTYQGEFDQLVLLLCHSEKGTLKVQHLEFSANDYGKILTPKRSGGYTLNKAARKNAAEADSLEGFLTNRLNAAILKTPVGLGSYAEVGTAGADIAGVHSGGSSGLFGASSSVGDPDGDLTQHYGAANASGC